MAGAAADPVALNRATLARQHLLVRRPAGTDPLDELRHLVGMQAQVPQAPYLGLAARIQDFDPSSLSRALERHEAVRLAVMRSTLHLVAADDAHELRRLTQAASDRAFQANWAKKLRGANEGSFCKAGAELLRDASSPRLLAEVGEHICGMSAPNRGYGADAIAALLRTRHALAQPPPRGLWRRSGAAKHVLLDSIVAPPAVPKGKPSGHGRLDLPGLARRYLAAFGPATPADFASWAGLAVGAAKPAFLELGARCADGEPLVDLGGGVMDLAHAPRPDADTPAPVRFLPEYDNVTLAHDDRARMAHPRATGTLAGQPGGVQPFTLDGFVAGRWSVDEAASALDVHPVVPLRRDDRHAIEGEAASLAPFVMEAPDASLEVRFHAS